MRLLTPATLTTILLIGFTSDASAQVRPFGGTNPYSGGFGRPGTGGGYSRPTYSPYLNLTRGGNPAFNYYGLVRPELDFRRAITDIQGQFNAFGGAGPTGTEEGGTVTGHRVLFDNLSHYYAGLGASGSSRAGGGMGTTATPRVTSGGTAAGGSRSAGAGARPAPSGIRR